MTLCATTSQVGQQTVAGPCFSPHLRRISPLCALQRRRSATILQTCDTLARNLRHFGRSYIEQKTGFDPFTNLPDGIEEDAEANTDWSAFRSF